MSPKPWKQRLKDPACKLECRTNGESSRLSITQTRALSRPMAQRSPPPRFTGLSVCLSLRPAGSSMFRVNPSEPSPPLVPLRLSRSAPASTALCVPSSSNDRGRLPPCKVPLRPKPCVPLTLPSLSKPSHALLLNKNQRRQVPFLFPM